jgi:hypothetical protein
VLIGKNKINEQNMILITISSLYRDKLRGFLPLLLSNPIRRRKKGRKTEDVGKGRKMVMVFDNKNVVV